MRNFCNYGHLPWNEEDSDRDSDNDYQGGGVEDYDERIHGGRSSDDNHNDLGNGEQSNDSYDESDWEDQDNDNNLGNTFADILEKQRMWDSDPKDKMNLNQFEHRLDFNDRFQPNGEITDMLDAKYQSGAVPGYRVQFACVFCRNNRFVRVGESNNKYSTLAVFKKTVCNHCYDNELNDNDADV